MKPTKITHYCEACKEKHTLIENQWPFWNQKNQDGRVVFWCSKGIDCVGCKKIHKREGIIKGRPGEHGTQWYCDRHFKTHGNGEVVWENYSPQEVLSGVHMGFERDKVYGEDTEDHTIVHNQQLKEYEQALDELEEKEAEEAGWK